MTSLTDTTTSTTAVEAGLALDLEARMALVNIEMTARLDLAALTFEVNTAHASTTADLADVVRGPVATPLLPLTPYPTPVAALLQRAARRLEQGGWCRGMDTDGDGATCDRGAIRAEAESAAQEAAAMDVLLEAIRRRFPGAATVPSWNDDNRDSRLPVRLMWQAAELANTRNI